MTEGAKYGQCSHLEETGTLEQYNDKPFVEPFLQQKQGKWKDASISRWSTRQGLNEATCVMYSIDMILFENNSTVPDTCCCVSNVDSRSPDVQTAHVMIIITDTVWQGIYTVHVMMIITDTVWQGIYTAHVMMIITDTVWQGIYTAHVMIIIIDGEFIQFMSW